MIYLYDSDGFVASSYAIAELGKRNGLVYYDSELYSCNARCNVFSCIMEYADFFFSLSHLLCFARGARRDFA